MQPARAREAHTLTGLDGWLNTSATSLEEIRAANQIRFDRRGDGRATYEQLHATVEQLLAEA